MEPLPADGVVWNARSPCARLKGTVIAYASRTLLVLALLTGCDEPAAETPTRDGLVYLVPIGQVPAAELERARLSLTSQTERTTLVLPMLALPELKPGQTRHDAGALLDALLATAPGDTFRIAGVTTAPLRAAEHDTLIGYARRGGRALIYSTDGLWPMLVTEAAHRRFTRRIIAHELGHTHGASHCEQRCVLSDVKDAVDIDDQPDGYCAEHAAMADEALAVGPEHPDAKIRLGAERLRLGFWREAVGAYRHALRSRPGDPRVRTSLGVALMAHGEWLAAEQAFSDATRDTPDAPQPFYARAVLYAASGDHHRAPAFIEAAVSRDGDQKRAHRAAGILYEDVIGDDRSAARHYHAHLRAGGRNPVVIERLVKLISPTTLVFHDPELVIARWQPGEGLVLASARGYSGGFR